MIFCALPAMSPTVTFSWAVQIVSAISDVPDLSNDYRTRVLQPAELDAGTWNALLALAGGSPFMRHEYLAALQDSGSAVPDTGWTPQFVTLWREGELHAACPMYLKSHSYGEYVFDWAWANAYEQHGLRYYPKALTAVPFTPVPGPRLLAREAAARAALVRSVLAWCKQKKVSSWHLLFASDEDVAACRQAGLMLRHTVQFHWMNNAPTRGADASALPPEGAGFPLGRPGGEAAGYSDFDAFLASLTQEKRKKIRQERRKVAEAGVTFRHARGREISAADWKFFYRCYERTYLEHGNAPYLTRDFFARMAQAMPENWLLFIAERGGKPIASSLIGIGGEVAYGRYWGALERVDCLHFEACYYQPLAWCIANGMERFEGGAQGEHKMARALMPVRTTSAHWLAHPDFADAVEKFLAREGRGIEGYLEHLEERSPFRHGE
jgi:predicted N-acyltransferase